MVEPQRMPLFLKTPLSFRIVAWSWIACGTKGLTGIPDYGIMQAVYGMIFFLFIGLGLLNLYRGFRMGVLMFNYSCLIFLPFLVIGGVSFDSAIPFTLFGYFLVVQLDNLPNPSELFNLVLLALAIAFTFWQNHVLRSVEVRALYDPYVLLEEPDEEVSYLEAYANLNQEMIKGIKHE